MKDGPNLYSYVGNAPTTFKDPSGKARAPGHYYLVLFLSLAAGFNPNMSYQNAFYSQMPDEVEELDAISVKIQEMVMSESPLAYFDPPQTLIPYGNPNYTAQIQKKVHGLTGGPSRAVRENTTAALLATDPTNYIRTGLLSHRYVDLMHSRIGDEENMYPISPLIEGWGHATASTHPDDLDRRPELVRDIAVGYFRILTEIGKKRGVSPVLTEQQIAQAVAEVTPTRCATR